MAANGRYCGTAAVIAFCGFALSLGSIPLYVGQARLLSDCAAPDLLSPDAVICLGYSCDHTRGVPSPTLEFRVEAAVALWRQRGGTLVFSGGASERVRAGLPTEADVMAAYSRQLLRVGEEPTMLLERRSTSTRENALFSLPMLKNCSAERYRVIIVTSAFHQWRALRVFRLAARDLGLDAQCEFEFRAFPCASESERAPTQYDWLRELAACVLYFWKGWI